MWRRALIGLLLCSSIQPLHAATVGWIGQTQGNIAFFRPDVSGPVAPTGLAGHATGFTALPFEISEDGLFRIDTFAGFRAIVGLYHSSFDATRPKTNALTFEFGNISDISLTTGRPYFALLTGEDSADFGSYALTVTGPGSIIGFDPLFFPEGTIIPLPDPFVSAVPEPSQWALLLAGFTLCGWTIRIRKRRGLSSQRL
jgi:hypothetical protein